MFRVFAAKKQCNHKTQALTIAIVVSSNAASRSSGMIRVVEVDIHSPQATA
jgi:hypothetical protein